MNCPLEIFEDDEKEEKGEAKDSEDGDEYEVSFFFLRAFISREDFNFRFCLRL